MKYFNIKKGATLPYIEMEPVVNGRDSFLKLYNAIQTADVRFSMKNNETDVWKIMNAKAFVVNCNEKGCEERFKIQYRWNKRDTMEKGSYSACFVIKFNEDMEIGDYVLPKGELIIPIYEELIVNVI